MKMAVTQNTFGRAFQGSNDSGNSDGNASSNAGVKRPSADYWLNVGYSKVIGSDEQGNPRSTFVSTPRGIALDNMIQCDTAKTNSKEYADLQANQNKLYDDIMAVARTLKPGEERILNLKVQLRRKKEENAPVVVTDDSPFAREEPLVLA
jgi:hypothetical protein